MTQINKKEMEMLAQCQCLPTQSSKSSTVISAIIRSNYANIKKKLKEEIISSIFKLQVKSSAIKHKQISYGKASQQWKGKSPKKSSPKKLASDNKKPLDTDATNIPYKWFDEHIDPNKKEHMVQQQTLSLHQLQDKKRKSNKEMNTF